MQLCTTDSLHKTQFFKHFLTMQVCKFVLYTIFAIFKMIPTYFGLKNNKN